MSDQELSELAVSVGAMLLGRGLRLATAESCTGGYIGKILTDIAGSSRWFECGYVTYSNAAKVRDLGVAAATLIMHGAVSESCAGEMAGGALRMAGVDLAVAVTGIAGPDGALPDKPVGMVWFGCAVRSAFGVTIGTYRAQFTGDRDAVRRLSVQYALKLILAVKS